MNPITTAASAPSLSTARAASLAREVFGIVGVATDLGGYEDQNLRIDTAGGAFLLKVTNPATPAGVLDLQNAAMRHAWTSLGDWVPRPLPAPDGPDVVEVYDECGHGSEDGKPYRVRLLTYLPGAPLRDAGYLAPPLLAQMGQVAGQITSALQDFDHSAADRGLAWDVQQVDDVVETFLPSITDPRQRALIERVHDRAMARLANLRDDLRRQVIHGDITDWNLLTTVGVAGRPELCGVLDFGDVSRSWLASECAITALAAIGHDPGQALANTAHVVRGFHSTRPLLDVEVAALPALIAARAVLSAVNCAHQVALEPERAYVVQSAEVAFARLESVAAFPLPVAHAAFAEACELRLAEPRVRLAERPHVVLDALAGDVSVIDVSVTSDDLRFGSWLEPGALADVVAERQQSSPGALPLGGHGERCLTGAGRPALEEPDTVRLGTDLFVAAGSTVRAPVSAQVLDVRDDRVVLALDDDQQLILAGVRPTVTAGTTVDAGAAVGVVQSFSEFEPPHLHVQVAPRELVDPPRSVPASSASAWLQVSPDPAPLLGLASTAAPVPEPQEVMADRQRSLAGPYALYYPARPPQVERGWKHWIYDEGARPYLDLVNNIAVVGHSHPRIARAAARQMRLINTNSRFLYNSMGRFADRLASLFPDPLDTVFLLNSGSEANDLATQLARRATGRSDALSFAGAYHGWTAATNVTMAGIDPTGAVRPAHQLPAPHPAMGPYDRAAQEACQEVDRLIAEDVSPAFFICEPVLGNSGGVFLPDGYLQRVYAAVRSAGGVCIADEVQVGYGRLGRFRWGFEQQGVVPDIVTIAKMTGNGHPVAAVITTRAIAEAFHQDERSFFSSVAGSPVSCEVGLAVLDVMDDEDLQNNAQRVGDYLQDQLAPLMEEHRILSANYGTGLYQGIEVVRDGDPTVPAPAETMAICDRMRELGVIVQPTGLHNNVLKVKPPLCITESDIDFFLSALKRTLTEGW